VLQGTFLKHFKLVKEQAAEGLNNQAVSMFVAEGTGKVVSNSLSGEECLEALKYGLKS
jgi:hypothetical protein